MRIEIYVQARMGSTRLPGKVMRPVMGKPLLEYLLERLKRVHHVEGLAVLTTANPADEAIEMLCGRMGICCYRGPEEDVLTRYHRVAIQRHPDAVVRITADCPLIDPEVIEQVIAAYREGHSKWDYVANILDRSYPRGFEVELFSMYALEQASKGAAAADEREHVTLYMYRHPELFRLKNVHARESYPQHRLTVDTEEDFALIERLLKSLYPTQPAFTLEDILKKLEQNPSWLELNAHIKQKGQ